MVDFNKYFIYKEGKLYNKITRNYKALKGAESHIIGSSGYLKVNVTGHQYYVHRLIYETHFGKKIFMLQIDHIDRDKTNNMLPNLRVVVAQQNHFNTNAGDSTWRKLHYKWRAQLMLNTACIYLGLFTNESEAIQAYHNAKQKYHNINDLLTN